MRKFIIASIAVIAVGIAFFAYISLMDSTPNIQTGSDQVPDIDITQTESNPQRPGDVVLGPASGAKYYKYDEDGNPVAEYGFERLLNPGQGSRRWEVEKPYIVFYQPDYKCRLDSEKGVFQIDTSGSTGVPNEAQLDKNVKIHIMPSDEGPFGETFIYMDNLIFSSERSEFTTDGPVRIDSPQIQMDGYGLIFIFNTAIRRIEYLQLRDLKYLRLKEVASAKNTPSPEASKDDPKQDISTESEKGDKKFDFYLCTIEDNVEIQYGNELIVSGADQVNIQNINFSEVDEEVVDSESSTLTGSPVDASSFDAAKNELKEVVVKCDGGIILQPMQANPVAEMPNSEPDLTLEMSGTPLRIDRIVSAIPIESQALARCGLLTYRPAEDVLRMFTSPLQPQILLNAEDSQSRIQTSGNVFWDRKAQHANIAGPGKVTIGNAKIPGAEPSEINFQGVMDMMFARMSREVSAPTTIQAINLTGGMDAVLRQNGTYKTKSNSAALQFGDENQLAQANLIGDVYLESLDTEKPSQAVSQSAIFHFKDNRIAKADLAGNVRFASNEGRFSSTNAVIEFKPDAGGSVQPARLRTAGQAVMETASQTTQPPAKFEAQKIDYDLETGSGLAYGPIRVTSYEPADPDSGSLDNWVPMTISADDDAQFYADQNRAIRQVQMRDNVVASRLTRTADFTRRDQIHGDKLVVNFDEDTAGDMMIRDLAVTEGNVFVQSTKVHDEEILFNVKLYCERLDYNSLNEEVMAAGPGKIELDNSKVKPAENETEGVQFNRPCFAVIDGFETLKWNMMDLTMVADAQDDQMQLTYVPVKDGVEEKYMYLHSRHMQVGFLSNSDDKLELKDIFTDQGIYFEQTDMFNEKTMAYFFGQTLKYDAYSDADWITITGTEAVPCNANGIPVPKIRYNFKTHDLETGISTMPGIISN